MTGSAEEVEEVESPTSDDTTGAFPPKLVALLVALGVSLPIDWLSKAWISRNLVLEGPFKPVIDGFFYLSHVRNPGAAFGLFADLPIELRRIGFVGVAALASWVVVFFYRGLAPGDRWNGIALGLVLGGGLGNLWDRLTRGEVIDFLHFRLSPVWSFPDFNFADMFIVVGVGVLMIELLVSENLARANAADPLGPEFSESED